MSLSTMAGSPHAVLDENGLYIESKLLLDDLQDKIKSENFGLSFKLFSEEVIPDQSEVVT